MAEVVHGAVDEFAAVVSGDDLHAGRQAAFQLLKLGLDGGDGLPRVLATAQDHHPAHGFALTVQLAHAPAQVRAQLDGCHVAKHHGHIIRVQAQRNPAKILQRLEVTGRPHHVLGFAHVQHRAASFLVGFADGLHHLCLGDAAIGQGQRIELHLVLLDLAADGRDFGHIGQGLEFELEEPVLQGTQLRQVMLAAAVNQCVLVDPANASGVRPQRRFGRCGQARLQLAEVFQHPRARPIQVGAFVEQHIDVAVAEE